MANDDEVFVDVSIINDYYDYTNRKRQKYASAVLEFVHSSGNLAVVSKAVHNYLIDFVNNSYQILSHLLNQATRILKEGISEPKKEYKADVLNYTDLSAQLHFDLDETHKEKIGILRDKLTEVGLEEFRDLLDSVMQEMHSLQIRLRECLISDTYSSNQSNWQFDTAINNIVPTEVQGDSLIDAVYWSTDSRIRLYLISEWDDLCQKRDEVNKRIRQIFSRHKTLDIFTSAEFVSENGLNPDQYTPRSIESE